MKRTKTPTFLVELPLYVDWSQESRVRAHLEAARCLYNALLGEAYARLRHMRNDPAWAVARSIPRLKKQERAQAFSALRKKYHFSEYELHEYAKHARVSWIADHIDSTMAQTLATRAYQAVNRVCVGKAKRVRFRSSGRGIDSVEGKRNDVGLRFLQERDLELSQEKTKITHITEGFDFLGQNVRKYKQGKKMKLHHQTRQEANTPLSGKSPRDRERSQAGHSRKTDRDAQPPHSWVGVVSPACGQQNDLHESGPRHVPACVAMGTEEASPQREEMDTKEILPYRWKPALGLLWNRHREEWGNPRSATADNGKHGYSKACESPKGRQSVRPCLGTLL